MILLQEILHKERLSIWKMVFYFYAPPVLSIIITDWSIIIHSGIGLWNVHPQLIGGGYSLQTALEMAVVYYMPLLLFRKGMDQPLARATQMSIPTALENWLEALYGICSC